MSRDSILFVRPDYHCSFFYRNELRRLGWKADVFVDWKYPERLLYSDKDVLRAPAIRIHRALDRYVNAVLTPLYYLAIFWRYKVHFYYGDSDCFQFHEKRLGLSWLVGPGFRLHLWMAKLCSRIIVQIPSGCKEEETKRNFSRFDGGKVCGNCGLAQDFCRDTDNVARFDKDRRYTDMFVGTGSHDSTQYRMTHFKYKAIDLELWKPGLEIPEEFKLPPTGNLRVLHSFYKQNREHGGKNIKGSPFILAAVERLRGEGHKVEYQYVTDVPSRDMRFYQAQADIVVEQLIYGWWGSTFVEASALGKPVICYLRPSWKAFFLKTFPEYRELPVVEATTEDIYDVLKKLVVDGEYRREAGRRARRFAESHFDPKKNAPALAELLRKL